MHCPLEGRKYEPLFILNGALKDVLQIIDIDRVCIQTGIASMFETALLKVVYDWLNLCFVLQYAPWKVLSRCSRVRVTHWGGWAKNCEQSSTWFKFLATEWLVNVTLTFVMTVYAFALHLPVTPNLIFRSLWESLDINEIAEGCHGGDLSVRLPGRGNGVQWCRAGGVGGREG